MNDKKSIIKTLTNKYGNCPNTFNNLKSNYCFKNGFGDDKCYKCWDIAIKDIKFKDEIWVKCVNDLGSKDLTINKEYMVIYQGEHWIEIINDSNNNYTYLIKAFEIVKENGKMKEYIVTELLDFPVGTRFKNEHNEILRVAYTDIMQDNKCLIHEWTKHEIKLTTNWFKSKFIKIPEPVSFMDAVNAGLEGKMIKVDVTELNEKYSNDEIGTCVLNSYWNNCWSSIRYIFEMLGKTEKHTSKIINEGKWYIKED